MPINTTNFNKVRAVFFFSLIAILGLVLLYIFRPFFYPLFWAAIIAILFYPLYTKILKYFKSPTLSSIITLILVVVILFVPLFLLGTLAVNESISLYTKVAEGNLFEQVKDVKQIFDNTWLEPYAQRLEASWPQYAESAAKSISIFIFDNLKVLTQNSFNFVFALFMMFYSLYYFLKDGTKILRRLMHLSPLGDEHEEMLYYRFTSTARATLKGTFIVGGIQGLLGGILFWIMGIEGAVIWGILMTALSIIPAVGASIIWFPAGIIMLIMGNFWQGLTILIVGVGLISTIDNFLRPILVGKDIQMHPLIVLFSTLGGIFLFGISGFIIGPAAAALFIAIVSIYEHHYSHFLNKN